MNPDTTRRQGGHSRWQAAIALLILLALGSASLLNAWRYTVANANPAMFADAWYFAGAFVEPQVEGTLEWRDFFVKRGPSDHAQPLHKLWMAANVRWFGLDFQLDALVAFAGLVLCVLGLTAVGIRSLRGRPVRISDGIALAAIPMLMFSLNSPEIYGWPLVMQFYLVLPFALLLFAACARETTGGWGLVFIATLGAALALDGGGLLAGIASVLALLLRGWRQAQWRDALTRTLAVIAALVIWRLAWWSLMPAFPETTASEGAAAVMGLPRDLESWWKIATIPATASLVHWDTLIAEFGSPEATNRAVAWIGVAVIVLHAVFWLSIWRTLARSTTSAFACMLMLYVYGMWAGVVLGRVPDYGATYLWQGRYVAFFQLANVALVLQWLAAMRPESASRPHLRSAITLAISVSVVAGLAALQMRLSDNAWHRTPYAQDYLTRSVSAIHCLARHSEVEQLICPPEHVVCEWGPEVRRRLVALLQTHQLNVFSPQVQARHGLGPNPNGDDACLPAKP